MNKNLKITTAFLIALVMLISMFVPTMKVFATDYTYTLTFTTTGHTFSEDNGHLKIDGNYYLDLNNVTFSDPSTGSLVVSVTDATHATIAVTNGSAGTINYHGTPTNPEDFSTGYTLYTAGNPVMMDTDNSYNSDTQIAVQDYNPASNPNSGGGNGGGGNTPSGNTTATVNVTGNNYDYARIEINGSPIYLPIRGQDEVPATFTDDSFSYNYDNTTNSGTVDITFGTLFVQKFTKVKVNGTTYTISDYINYTNRENWLDHYDYQTVSFTIPGVTKADTYNIEVDVGSAEDDVYVGNFLWTSDPEQEGEDVYVAHSKIELVKIAYERNGATVTKTLNQLNDLGERETGPDIYNHEYTDGDVEYGYLTKLDGNTVNFDDGSLVVPEGARVTMRLVPEYGYQVTSFTINGDDVVTGDNVSEFTFTVHRGNGHMGAKVTAVNNDVKSSTDAVTSGSIKLGNSEISSGTARLSVNDATVSTEKKQGFENEAASDGYSISQYLDIDLNQVFFKGTGSSNDVWNGDTIEDLNEEATISLQLADSIDPNATEIVHNIHDGTEFEKIAIDNYDESTKTITFKAKSFSNYAIATKTSSATSSAVSSKNPTTGDIIMIFVGIFAVSTAGFVITRKINRKK